MIKKTYRTEFILIALILICAQISPAFALDNLSPWLLNDENPMRDTQEEIAKRLKPVSMAAGQSLIDLAKGTLPEKIEFETTTKEGDFSHYTRESIEYAIELYADKKEDLPARYKVLAEKTSMNLNTLKDKRKTILYPFSSMVENTNNYVLGFNFMHPEEENRVGVDVDLFFKLLNPSRDVETSWKQAAQYIFRVCLYENLPDSSKQKEVESVADVYRTFLVSIFGEEEVREQEEELQEFISQKTPIWTQGSSFSDRRRYVQQLKNSCNEYTDSAIVGTEETVKPFVRILEAQGCDKIRESALDENGGKVEVYRDIRGNVAYASEIVVVSLKNMQENACVLSMDALYLYGVKNFLISRNENDEKISPFNGKNIYSVYVLEHVADQIQVPGAEIGCGTVFEEFKKRITVCNGNRENEETRRTEKKIQKERRKEEAFQAGETVHRKQITDKIAEFDGDENEYLISTLWQFLLDGEKENAELIAEILREKGFMIRGIRIGRWDDDIFTQKQLEGIANALGQSLVEQVRFYQNDQAAKEFEETDWLRTPFYELPGNMYRYTNYGYIITKVIRMGKKHMLQVVALDNGKGIKGPDLLFTTENEKAACGYEGNTGLGTGIIRSFTDEVTFEGIEGKGSRVTGYKDLGISKTNKTYQFPRRDSSDKIAELDEYIKQAAQHRKKLSPKDLDILRGLLSGIVEERALLQLKYRAELFKQNLMRSLKKNPEKIFALAIDTDIGEEQRSQIMPIWTAIDKIATMKNEKGEALFPNLRKIRGSGSDGTLMRKIQEEIIDNPEIVFEKSALFLVGKTANITDNKFDPLKGKAWITGIDDSIADHEIYLPVLEAITLTLMAASNADIESIKDFYDLISGEPIALEDLRNMIRDKLIYVLPKASRKVENLRELYEQVRSVYLAA